MNSFFSVPQVVRTRYGNYSTTLYYNEDCYESKDIRNVYEFVAGYMAFVYYLLESRGEKPAHRALIGSDPYDRGYKAARLHYQHELPKPLLVNITSGDIEDLRKKLDAALTQY